LEYITVVSKTATIVICASPYDKSKSMLVLNFHGHIRHARQQVKSDLETLANTTVFIAVRLAVIAGKRGPNTISPTKNPLVTNVFFVKSLIPTKLQK